MVDGVEAAVDGWHPDVIVAADNWDLLPDLCARDSGWMRVYRDDDGQVFVPGISAGCDT